MAIPKSLYLRDYWELVGQPVHRYNSVQPSGAAGHVSGTLRSVWDLILKNASRLAKNPVFSSICSLGEPQLLKPSVQHSGTPLDRWLAWLM